MAAFVFKLSSADADAELLPQARERDVVEGKERRALNPLRLSELFPVQRREGAGTERGREMYHRVYGSIERIWSKLAQGQSEAKALEIGRAHV